MTARGNDRLAITLGGRTFMADRPSPVVLDALMRADRAITARRNPDPSDLELVVDWLNEQERKYPTDRSSG